MSDDDDAEDEWDETGAGRRGKARVIPPATDFATAACCGGPGGRFGGCCCRCAISMMPLLVVTPLSCWRGRPWAPYTLCCIKLPSRLILLLF